MVESFDHSHLAGKVNPMDLITVTLTNKWVDRLLAEKENMQPKAPCDPALAVEAAKALDKYNLPKASSLLADCGVDSTAFTVDSRKFQTFAEQVVQAEQKGKGLDLTLNYGVGRMSAFYLEGMEIK